MGIEWNNVDLALFESLPRKDENLEIVVEAKKKGNSCLTAKSQAERYANKRDNCRRLIVTDGLRYGIHIKDNDQFIFHSYLNLTDLKSGYPIYDCPGAKESLWAMTPEWKTPKQEKLVLLNYFSIDQTITTGNASNPISFATCHVEFPSRIL